MSEVTGGDLIATLWRRAAATQARIALPETGDARVREAAVLLAARGVRPVLVGTASDLARLGEVAGIEHLDPFTGESESATRRVCEAAPRLARLTVTERNARLQDPLTRAAALLALRRIDGVVAGATHTTADVLRAGLALLGLAPGVQTVSSAFLMLLPEAATTQIRAPAITRRAFIFADCGVVPEPTAPQLADIALAAAGLAAELLRETPRVALLSFSTAGSAEGDSPRRIRDALALLHARAAEYRDSGTIFLGEIQADAALLPEVAHRKGVASDAAANVLVFPNLDSGNIAYKLVERLAGARAVGPLLAGFPVPYHDLSRGASAEDIALAGCIAAVQSAARPRTEVSQAQES